MFKRYTVSHITVKLFCRAFEELYQSVQQTVRILCEGLKELRPFYSVKLAKWFGNDQHFENIFKIWALLEHNDEHVKYVQYVCLDSTRKYQRIE